MKYLLALVLAAVVAGPAFAEGTENNAPAQENTAPANPSNHAPTKGKMGKHAHAMAAHGKHHGKKKAAAAEGSAASEAPAAEGTK